MFLTGCETRLLRPVVSSFVALLANWIAASRPGLRVWLNQVGKFVCVTVVV